ncbi:MAG: hypothetical protein GY696_21405 [Gammaproteobacteria bacterium]|nr:hypothetical protein [Gammaproteobacteria bacterium]
MATPQAFFSITTTTSSQTDSTQRDAETPTPTEGMETAIMTSSTATTATSSQEGSMQGVQKRPLQRPKEEMLRKQCRQQ